MVRWKYHRDSGSRSGRSEKSPAPVNVKGLKLTVTFTRAVSAMGRFAGVFVRRARTSLVPLARSQGRARAGGSGEGSGRCMGAAEEAV